MPEQIISTLIVTKSITKDTKMKHSRQARPELGGSWPLQGGVSYLGKVIQEWHGRETHVEKIKRKKINNDLTLLAYCRPRNKQKQQQQKAEFRKRYSLFRAADGGVWIMCPFQVVPGCD